MIPLSLITGFLGSGKTTLLRRLIERYRGRPMVWLVNEFGQVDVDGQLLELPPGELVSIPGGSIFCRCLVGEFVRVLREVAGTSAPGAGSPAGVVVEASGIADPKVVGQMLAETRLDAYYELQRIVTVIDPGSFPALLETLPNIVAQVEAADLAIINKVDLHDEQRIAEVEQEVRRINPSAELVRAVQCDVDFGVFTSASAGEARRSLAGQYAACADPNYVTRTIVFDRPIDAERLLVELRALQPHIYRAKGFVPTSGGILYVDVSASGVDCRPAGEATAGGRLVVIAAPAVQTRVDALVRMLQCAGEV